MTGTCGHPTNDDGECKNPAGSNGRCWIPSHNPESDADQPGRNTKFTEERRHAIIDAAKNGLTQKGCARAAGIGESTLYEWLDAHPEFSERFRRARNQAEMELVEAVRHDDPKFILERSYDYTKTEKREVDMDADVDLDASEGVTAEFVTYEEANNGGE